MKTTTKYANNPLDQQNETQLCYSVYLNDTNKMVHKTWKPQNNPQCCRECAYNNLY